MSEKKNTGFEKFMRKQFTEGVKIGTATGEKRVSRTEREESPMPELVLEVPAVEEEVAANIEEPVVSEQERRVGRPKMAENRKDEIATIIIKVDRDVKKKLEDLKHETYKSSVKDVIMEAVYDLFQKYGIK